MATTSSARSKINDVSVRAGLTSFCSRRSTLSLAAPRTPDARCASRTAAHLGGDDLISISTVGEQESGLASGRMRAGETAKNFKIMVRSGGKGRSRVKISAGHRCDDRLVNFVHSRQAASNQSSYCYHCLGRICFKDAIKFQTQTTSFKMLIDQKSSSSRQCPDPGSESRNLLASGCSVNRQFGHRLISRQNQTLESTRRYECAANKTRQAKPRTRPFSACRLLASIMLPLALILVGNGNIHIVDCDSSLATSGSVKQSAVKNPAAISSPASVASEKSNLLSSSWPAPQLHSRPLKTFSSSSHSGGASEWEKPPISSKGDTERQHPRPNPSLRSLVLARPSKFDSGEESLRNEPRDMQIITRGHKLFAPPPSSPSPRSQQVLSMDDIMRQHQQYQSPASLKSQHYRGTFSKSAPTSKADSDLRQIEMLHEQAAAVSSNSKIMKQPAPMKVAPKSAFARIINHAREANLTSKSGAPESLAARPHRHNTNLLSGVMSFLGPVPVKPSEPLSSSSTKTKGTDEHNNNTSKSFEPRAIARTYLAGPLLGLSQMFAPQMLSITRSRLNYLRSPLSSVPSFMSASTESPHFISDAVSQAQSFKIKDKSQLSGGDGDDLAADSSAPIISTMPSKTNNGARSPSSSTDASWVKKGANHLAQNYLQDSLRDLLTLSQLPVLSGGPVSTAPSELEPGGKRWLANRVASQQIQGNRTQAIDDLFRYAFILTNGVRRKRDPLKALGSSASSSSLHAGRRLSLFKLHSHLQTKPPSVSSSSQTSSSLIHRLPMSGFNSLLVNRKIKPRGVMWDMATDPSLAVTVFHLLERASVALPLGVLLMPLVQMIRHPLNGINLGRIIPARASHRSVDYEELAKRLDMMDKIFSRALRSTHREASVLRTR